MKIAVAIVVAGEFNFYVISPYMTLAFTADTPNSWYGASVRQDQTVVFVAEQTQLIS